MAQAAAPDFDQALTSVGFLLANAPSKHTSTSALRPLIFETRSLAQQHQTQAAHPTTIAELLHRHRLELTQKLTQKLTHLFLIYQLTSPAAWSLPLANGRHNDSFHQGTRHRYGQRASSQGQYTNLASYQGSALVAAQQYVQC